MLCRHWIVDRYSPTRKKHKIESVAGPDVDSHTIAGVVMLIPQTKWSVENIRRCTGTIHAAFDSNYDGQQDGCDPWITYECDICHVQIVDNRLPNIETLDAHLQSLVDAIE